jgi:hypothetical protein
VRNNLRQAKQAVEAQWQALDDGECFFVPSLDAEADKKTLLSMGYVPRKNPPEAVVGFFRGMWGVFCYRRPKTSFVKAEPTPPARRRTVWTVDPEGA